jgi:hypothetical protein
MGRGSGVHSAGDGRRLRIRLRHRPPFLIVESLSISKPLEPWLTPKMSNSLFARGCFGFIVRPNQQQYLRIIPFWNSPPQKYTDYSILE